MSIGIPWRVCFRHAVILLTIAIFLPITGKGQIPVPDEPSASVSPAAAVEPKPDSPTTLPPDPPKPAASLERQFVKNVLSDQVAIWTAPFHLKKSDAWVLTSLVVSTGGLIASDQYTATLIDKEGSHLEISDNISRIGAAYTTFGTAAAFYLIGRHSGNEHARETGLIAAEALCDAWIVSGVLKGITQRPRPDESDGHGRFFTGGYSFPSGHSIQIWTLATVISKEYGCDHPVVSFVMYGLASMTSVSRYTGRKHFLSDVFVVGALGYGIGRYTYNKRHDTSLDQRGGVRKRCEFVPTILPQFDPLHRYYGVTLNWGQ